MGIRNIQPVIAEQLKVCLLCDIYMPDIIDKRNLCPGFFYFGCRPFFFAVEYYIRKPRRKYFIYPF